MTSNTFTDSRILKIVTIVVLFNILPTACGLFESCESENYFAITGLTSQNLKISNSSTVPWVGVEDGSIIEWNDYFIQVVFEANFYSENKKLGGSNLYAFDCAPPGYQGSEIGVKNLHIIALTNYNDQYLQNDTINNAVQIIILEYSKTDFNDTYSVESYLDENKAVIKNPGFGFLITEPPLINNSEQQFKIVYELTNGETFITTTGIVKLTI